MLATLRRAHAWVPPDKARVPVVGYRVARVAGRDIVRGLAVLLRWFWAWNLLERRCAKSWWWLVFLRMRCRHACGSLVLRAVRSPSPVAAADTLSSQFCSAMPIGYGVTVAARFGSLNWHLQRQPDKQGHVLGSQPAQVLSLF